MHEMWKGAGTLTMSISPQNAASQLGQEDSNIG